MTVNGDRPGVTSTVSGVNAPGRTIVIDKQDTPAPKSQRTMETTCTQNMIGECPQLPEARYTWCREAIGCHHDATKSPNPPSIVPTTYYCYGEPPRSTTERHLMHRVPKMDASPNAPSTDVFYDAAPQDPMRWARGDRPIKTSTK